MKGLAGRGHQVDVVSRFPQKKPYPNYTDIGLSNSISLTVNNLSYSQWGKMRDNLIDFCVNVAGNNLCETGLDSPEIQKLIRNPPNDPPYDLVIVEVLCANCFIAFGQHLKVPVIGMSSCVMYPFNHDVVANPENLAFVPNNLMGHRKNMNLWNRLYNVVNTIYAKVYYNYYTSIQTDMIRKHFGPNMPTVHELEKSIALVLVNSHFSLNGVRPNTPAHIEVGGLHIQDDHTEIPVEHKKWLDDSEDGFVYFTFGSMVTIETLPRNILDNIFKSLRKISPIRVFMKVPRPELLPPGVPENIRTFDWIPQLKVLKHKNILAFFTHGGLMSTQEAIHCGVPMIGVPLFGDQFLNIERYVHRKLAIRVDFDNLSQETLDAAFHEILNNPIYRETVKNASRKFLDRPLSAMDTACYWVEYILRHGSNALRSPALDMTWWQLALLDVYCILLIAGIVMLFILCKLIQCFIQMLNHSSIISRTKKHN
nr:UDP-glucosyltransferase 334AA3 [Meteorus pulchricornis]